MAKINIGRMYERSDMYKLTLPQIELIYNAAYEFIKKEYGFVPDVEEFDFEFVEGVGHKLTYFNDITITDIFNDLTIEVKKKTTLKWNELKQN